MAVLDDLPRPGKAPTITVEARAWLVSLACDKAKDHGYPHELWTTARHARDHGVLAALDDLPRPGKEPRITAEARAWLVSLACDKAKDHGYPHELWTTRLLARHEREHCVAAGHACLFRLAQGTLCKILARQAIKSAITWERSLGGPCTHWKSAALPRRTPEGDVGTDSRFGRTAFRFSRELVHLAMLW